MNKYAILLLALAINAQEVHVEEQYPLPLVGMAVYDDPVTHFASMGQL